MSEKSTTQRPEPQDDKQAAEQAGAASASPEGVLPQGQSRFRRGIGRVLLVAAVAVGVAGLMYWVYGRYTNVVVYDARIKADMIMISSRIDGWVTKVPISEGDVLSAGQPLIIIDSRDSTLHLKEIAAQRSSLQAERERIQAEVHMIDQQTGGRYAPSRAALTASQAAKAGMDTEMEQIRIDFERAESLMLKKVISRQRWETYRTAFRIAAQKVLKLEADVAQANAAVIEAQADRQSMEILQGRVASLRFDEERLKTQYERQQLDLSDRTIKAPNAGKVDRIFIDPGEYVARGQRMLLLHDPSVIWVEANIKETDIRDVKLGAKAKIGIDAYPDLEVVGEVVRIGNAATNQFALLPSPNPSGSFTKITQRLPVKISVPQVDGLLRPGMMVEVEIAIARD